MRHVQAVATPWDVLDPRKLAGSVMQRKYTELDARPFGLRCPECGREQTTRRRGGGSRVQQTIDGPGGVVRRRVCECGYRFVTLEQPVDNEAYNAAERKVRRGGPPKRAKRRTE